MITPVNISNLQCFILSLRKKVDAQDVLLWPSFLRRVFKTAPLC